MRFVLSHNRLIASRGRGTGMIAARRCARILVSTAIVAALAACSPSRAFEAARVLDDIAAVDGPSGLKAATPTPSRTPVAYSVEGRSRGGDLYRPGEAARAGIVLVPGAAEAGKDDRRLVAFANTLARAGFAVLVPDIASLRALKVQASDAREIADAIGHLASRDELAPNGRVGVVAISYAVGPAVIAALEPDVRDRLRFIVGIGGYHDIEAVVTFFTTGYYRARPAGPWRYREPNAYGKWVFVLGNADRVEDARDATTLEAMARRKLADSEADVSDLAADFGAEGRAFHALITNRDPERVPALIAALPEPVRAEIAALDLARRDLGRLKARLILVHGSDDSIIPPTESRALAAAAPQDAADLYIVDGLAHVDTPTGLVGRVQLWRAVYRLLEERGAAP